MNQLVFDEKRGKAFIEHMMRAYNLHNPQYLFVWAHHENGHAPQRVFCPQDVIPGSLSHAVWLYFTTLFDYLSNSYDIFQTTEYLWRHYPEMFTNEVLSWSTRRIERALRTAKSTMPRAKAVRFLNASRMLYSDFLNGDPRNIFGLGKTIDEVMQRKRVEKKHHPWFLHGYEAKLVSLLALHYYDFGILKKIFPGSIPIDRHLQRQLIGCGVVKVKRISDEGARIDAARTVAEPIRQWMAKMCKQMNVPVFELAHAMWILGNKFCFACRYWHTQQQFGHLAYCPLYREFECQGYKLDMRIYQLTGKWGLTEIAVQKHDSESPQLLLSF